jgi:hypothetical protein
VSIRRAGAGCLAPDGLCRTCAARLVAGFRPSLKRAVPIVRMVIRRSPLWGRERDDGNRTRVVTWRIGWRSRV